MAKKKAKRTAVGRPLTPRMLRQELGGLDELASTPEDFKPDGSWINTYRIWTCHGYIESGNQSVGFLRIERIAGKAKEQFTLKVILPDYPMFIYMLSPYKIQERDIMHLQMIMVWKHF